MANPTTLQSPGTLSDLTGAYDTAHWETVVAQLKPASGVLMRGSVLSAVVADGGKLTLTVGGSEATAYGILLDASVDTGVRHLPVAPSRPLWRELARFEALRSSSGLEPTKQRSPSNSA